MKLLDFLGGLLGGLGGPQAQDGMGLEMGAPNSQLVDPWQRLLLPHPKHKKKTEGKKEKVFRRGWTQISG